MFLIILYFDSGEALKVLPQIIYFYSFTYSFKFNDCFFNLFAFLLA